MVRLTLATALLAVASTAQAVKSTKGPAILPGAYIVEYEDNHDGAKFLDSIKGDASKRMDLDFKLFKGASIQFKDIEKAANKAEQVAAMAAVKNLWPVHLYSVPEHTMHSVGAPGASVFQKRADSSANDTFTPHVMTQVNKLRDEGITGKGIKIGVIDTGTDYKHPALGGCFGPGCLVSFGTDLVGDDYTGFNQAVPDSDPWDNCNGHGSHVAGIIAAQAAKNPYGIVGAAEGVTLGSFRVFGCSGSASNDVLIAAFNMAYEAGADLITASIGGASGWSEDDWSVAVQRIVEAGVPCTVSAGNEGEEGLFYSSTAANGKRVTAIASVDNTVSPALLTTASYTVAGADNQTFGFTPGTPDAWGGVSLPLWSVNFDTTDTANACAALPDNTPDLSNKIVLVRRGSCTFAQKMTNVAAKGARYVVLYNNVAGVIAVTTDVAGIKAIAMVTGDQGATWIGALQAGSDVVVSMVDPDGAPQLLTNFPNTVSPGYLSSYTSWGPTNEVDFYPDLAAPGGQILSTWPLALGGYAVISGTSMACPLTAAVYALIMQKRGIKDPKTIQNLLAATANPNVFSNGAGTIVPSLAPAAQQGAGLIQAHDAAYATAILSTAGISFNDTDHFAGAQQFAIQNTAKTPITFQLSHVGALTAYTYSDDTTIDLAAFPNPLVSGQAATINFVSGSSITVPAGQTKTVSIVAVPPVGLDAKRLPVYSGYIALNGTDGSSYSVPYLGVVGSMNSRTVLDAPNTYITQSADADLAEVRTNTTFVLPPVGHANDTQYANVSLPVIAFNLVLGSPLIRVDIVPVSTCRPVKTTTVLGTKIIGAIIGSPYTYYPRGSEASSWDGQLTDGSYAPAGTYKFSVKALRIFGDSKVASQYDIVETDPFTIRYAKTGKKPKV